MDNAGHGYPGRRWTPPLGTAPGLEAVVKPQIPYLSKDLACAVPLEFDKRSPGRLTEDSKYPPPPTESEVSQTLQCHRSTSPPPFVSPPISPKFQFALHKTVSFHPSEQGKRTGKNLACLRRDRVSQRHDAPAVPSQPVPVHHPRQPWGASIKDHSIWLRNSTASVRGCLMATMRRREGRLFG